MLYASFFLFSSFFSLFLSLSRPLLSLSEVDATVCQPGAIEKWRLIRHLISANINIRVRVCKFVPAFAISVFAYRPKLKTQWSEKISTRGISKLKY